MNDKERFKKLKNVILEVLKKLQENYQKKKKEIKKQY